jgi:hypothetical protein
LRTVFLCLFAALLASSLLVNFVLGREYRTLYAHDETCMETAAGIYELALEQNNALNACVGELEDAARCKPRLEKCLGIK